MPVIPSSSYTAPFYMANGHVQTLFPPLFRKVLACSPQRQRIVTPDNDFLDVDFHYATPSAHSSHCVVLSHGLEGHSRRKYIIGMADALLEAGWDVAAWNFRGCSGETNKALRMYHSGVTDDLHTVISYCAEKGYAHIGLVGFSMGANQIGKYLGEAPEAVHPAVDAAVMFSVPCDLVGAAKQLDRWQNSIYMAYFLRSLREKVRSKHQRFPEQISLNGLDSMRTFREFDEAYTAPVHGFSSAQDYWEKCGCGQFLQNIQVPSLVVNAKNDPFLSATCFPYAIAEKSRVLTLEVPCSGGHVGFALRHSEGRYWSDLRAREFLQSMWIEN